VYLRAPSGKAAIFLLLDVDFRTELQLDYFADLS